MRSSKINKKAGGFVVFVSIIIPAAFFALAISIDHGRVILANRVAADIADTLALSAGGARVYDGDKFDLINSKNNASETIEMIYKQNVIPKYINIYFNKDLDLFFSSDNTKLSVTVYWEVKMLPFIDFITKSNTSFISGNVTRSAKICIAEQSKTPCAYPL